MRWQLRQLPVDLTVEFESLGAPKETWPILAQYFAHPLCSLDSLDITLGADKMSDLSVDEMVFGLSQCHTLRKLVVGADTTLAEPWKLLRGVPGLQKLNIYWIDEILPTQTLKSWFDEIKLLRHLKSLVVCTTASCDHVSFFFFFFVFSSLLVEQAIAFFEKQEASVLIGSLGSLPLEKLEVDLALKRVASPGSLVNLLYGPHVKKLVLKGKFGKALCFLKPEDLANSAVTHLYLNSKSLFSPWLESIPKLQKLSLVGHQTLSASKCR